MIQFPTPDLEEFYRYASVKGFAINHQEDRAALMTNLSGGYEIWELDLKTGYPIMLSHAGKNLHAVDYDPKGRYIVVTADADGDENTQLYLLPPSGGALEPLIQHQGYRHHVLHLSEDGDRLYYASNHENPQFYNNYRKDLVTGEESLLVTGTEVPTLIIQVSPGEQSWVLLKSYANTHMAGFLGTADGQYALVEDVTKPHVVYGALFANDHEVWFATNYGAERSYLARYDINQHRMEKVLEIPGEDLVEIHLDRAHQQIIGLTDRGVDQRAYRIDLKNPLAVPIELPVTLVAQMLVTETGTWYLAGQSESLPSNLYRFEAGDWKQLTTNRALGITEHEATRADVIRYPSFDGLEIEGLWFRPKEANGYTILWPHGGPQAMERRQFRPIFQYLTSLGYQIFAPNFRGSTGYGLAFTQMVEGDWGHGPRLDVLAGLDWLAREGLMDPRRVFVMGGSYGGYMALLLHGRHADRFRAVVDIFGPSDLRTFLSSVPETWKPMMTRWLGDPETQPEKFTEDSPITYVENMTLPMLVVQGANDPRVVQAESDQMVKALRERGRLVEYLVLENEGHGFAQKDNEIKAYRAIAEFLETQRKRLEALV